MKEIQVVCGVALKDDKVFLARRRPEKSYGGFWELPGGKVEPGETHESALARELSEELGIDVRVGEFIASGEGLPTRTSSSPYTAIKSTWNRSQESPLIMT